MKKQIAIQMDKIESIDYEFDTSFLIGYEAQQRDYDIFYYNFIIYDNFIKLIISNIIKFITMISNV